VGPQPYSEEEQHTLGPVPKANISTQLNGIHGNKVVGKENLEHFEQLENMPHGLMVHRLSIAVNTYNVVPCLCQMEYCCHLKLFV
jgi:hypothetical protein